MPPAIIVLDKRGRTCYTDEVDFEPVTRNVGTKTLRESSGGFRVYMLRSLPYRHMRPAAGGRTAHFRAA